MYSIPPSKQAHIAVTPASAPGGQECHPIERSGCPKEGMDGCPPAGELDLQVGIDALPGHGGRTSHGGSCYHTEDPLPQIRRLAPNSWLRSPPTPPLQPPGSREEELMALWPLVTFAFSTLYLNYLSFYFL